MTNPIRDNIVSVYRREFDHRFHHDFGGGYKGQFAQILTAGADGGAQNNGRERE